MRVYLVFCIPLCLIGGCLIMGPVGDDRGLWRIQSHLEIVQEQLAGLKESLLDFKSRHGRFPTNEEGLAALDNFDARLPVPASDLLALSGCVEGSHSFGSRGFRWKAVKDAVREHRERGIGWPRTTAELLDSRLGDWFYRSSHYKYAGPTIEFGVARSNDVYILSPVGVLSPWLIPYVYENRNGYDAAVFAQSPAAGDSWGRYSVCVAPGIYVSCVGGEYLAREADSVRFRRLVPRIIGGGLLLAAAALCVLAVRRSARKTAASIWGGLLLGTATLLGLGSHRGIEPTCYVMSPLFSRREPEMVSRRMDLLERYRAAGIITPATYAKTKALLENPAGTLPTSQPAK